MENQAMENQAMENQVMSSSSSSTPKPQKLKGVAIGGDPSLDIAMEENAATENRNEVMSERRSDENSRFRSGIFGTRKEITKIYQSKSNKIYICDFCKKEFSTSQALGGHQNAHRHEKDLEKKRKEMEENFPGLAFLSPYIDKPHLVLGGYSQDALSNENHLGITLEPFRPMGPRGIKDMNFTIVPRVTPTSFFPGNTSNQSHGSSIQPNQLRPLLPRPSLPRPLLPRNVTPFPPPPRNKVLSEQNLISKIGMNNIVEIDGDDEDNDDDDADLSLSL